MRTLPALAKEWGLNVNSLKSFVARRRALAALGTMVGKCRGYTATEAAKLKRAWETRPRRTAAAV